jgi:hypothetical protein
MKVKTHEKLNAGMLCIIAFAIGMVLAFAGCSAANKTEARIFDERIEFGGGLYMQEALRD